VAGSFEPCNESSGFIKEGEVHDHGVRQICVCFRTRTNVRKYMCNIVRIYFWDA
jgi:hypothetical protein